MRSLLILAMLAGCTHAVPAERVYQPWERMTAEEHAAFDGPLAELNATLARSDAELERSYRLHGVYDNTPSIIYVPTYYHSHHGRH